MPGACGTAPLKLLCFHTVQPTLPSYCPFVGVQLPHQVERCSLISKQAGRAAGQESWVNYNSKCEWASRPRKSHCHGNNTFRKNGTHLGYNFFLCLDLRGGKTSFTLTLFWVHMCVVCMCICMFMLGVCIYEHFCTCLCTCEGQEVVSFSISLHLKYWTRFSW